MKRKLNKYDDRDLGIVERNLPYLFLKLLESMGKQLSIDKEYNGEEQFSLFIEDKDED